MSRFRTPLRRSPELRPLTRFPAETSGIRTAVGSDEPLPVVVKLEAAAKALSGVDLAAYITRFEDMKLVGPYAALCDVADAIGIGDAYRAGRSGIAADAERTLHLVSRMVWRVIETADKRTRKAVG